MSTIPQKTVRALMRWQDEGVMPGDFLQAVLANDLLDAACRADDESLPALKAICLWVHWELPPQAHGTREALKAWAATFDREGVEA